jgi:hypothetical protein
VHALEVEGMEVLMRNATGPDRIESRTASLALQYYFAGVADLLNGAKGADGEVYYAGPRKICLPDGVRLSSLTVQAMTWVEIKTADASGAFKDGWKKQPLGMFVFLAMSRNYPCASKQ